MSTFLKKYPLSVTVIIAIIYLSFFTPPKTDMQEIAYIDKVVHFCMYGGLSTIIWIEYLWHHKEIAWIKLVIGGMVCPVLMSGLIEIGQSTLTETRSGEWMDFLANTAGVIAASVIGYYLWVPLKKKHQQSQKK